MTAILNIKVHNVKIKQTILQTTYPGHAFTAERWIEKIRSIGDKMNNTTNIKGTMTDYNDLVKLPEFDPIKDFALSIVKEHPRNTRADVDFEISNMWGAIYNKGDYTVPHWHWPSTYAFVYFLKSDNNSTPLCFTDSSEDFFLHPTESSFILFPAHLFHHVPHQKDDTDRIIIAGNIRNKG